MLSKLLLLRVVSPFLYRGNVMVLRAFVAIFIALIALWLTSEVILKISGYYDRPPQRQEWRPNTR
jgi:hypothetical protein